MIRTIKLDGWKLCIQSADEMQTLHYSLTRETKDGQLLCIEMEENSRARLFVNEPLLNKPGKAIASGGTLHDCLDEANTFVEACGGWKFIFLEVDVDAMQKMQKMLS